MKQKDVVIGRTYIVKVSGKLARVRIISESPYGGWDGENLDTKRDVRVRSAQRLRYEAGPSNSLVGAVASILGQAKCWLCGRMLRESQTNFCCENCEYEYNKVGI